MHLFVDETIWKYTVEKSHNQCTCDKNPNKPMRPCVKETIWANILTGTRTLPRTTILACFIIEINCPNTSEFSYWHISHVQTGMDLWVILNLSISLCTWAFLKLRKMKFWPKQKNLSRDGSFRDVQADGQPLLARRALHHPDLHPHAPPRPSQVGMFTLCQGARNIHSSQLSFTFPKLKQMKYIFISVKESRKHFNPCFIATQSFGFLLIRQTTIISSKKWKRVNIQCFPNQNENVDWARASFPWLPRWASFCACRTKRAPSSCWGWRPQGWTWCGIFQGDTIYTIGWWCCIQPAASPAGPRWCWSPTFWGCGHACSGWSPSPPRSPPLYFINSTLPNLDYSHLCLMQRAIKVSILHVPTTLIPWNLL